MNIFSTFIIQVYKLYIWPLLNGGQFLIMKKTLITTLLLSSICFAQTEKINFQAGFAHFDDTDGYEIATSYTRQINRYLDIEGGVSFASSSDFPNNYSFSESLNQSYFYSKSSIFSLNSLLHLTFIKTSTHNFSFFGGLGYMFINSVDNFSTPVDQTNFFFESNVESFRSLSNLIGIRYTFYINDFGFGFDARLNKPLSNIDDYFGQDNYRSINLLISKRLK